MAAPVRVGGALYPFATARERRSSQPPTPPSAPRALPGTARVSDARGGGRAMAPIGRLTRRGREHQHCRSPLLQGLQGDPGVARRVTDSGSGSGRTVVLCARRGLQAGATLKVAPCERGEGRASVPSMAVLPGRRTEPRQPRSGRTRGKRGGATTGRARPAPLL
ncbi:hypothetical protein NDU88_007397 [Pleurodeles waltl]|uniref:Uncharacterized protein n=1 Tax=Pleurodeles waltl TaxID=8319 RepID=A0AAV7URS5_PLEWA|nr:hypothetical protein NDU88_007397 [Pleurodeles waltl]